VWGLANTLLVPIVIYRFALAGALGCAITHGKLVDRRPCCLRLSREAYFVISMVFMLLRVSVRLVLLDVLRP
jgi:hypothetical protein